MWMTRRKAPATYTDIQRITGLSLATISKYYNGGNVLEANREAIKTAFEGVATLLKKNDRVSITGVGVFSKTVKPAQKGGQKAKNPFTGEEYVTKSKPASTKVKFRAGKGFKGGMGQK